jgi:hypothetical protein
MKESVYLLFLEFHITSFKVGISLWQRGYYFQIYRKNSNMLLKKFIQVQECSFLSFFQVVLSVNQPIRIFFGTNSFNIETRFLDCINQHWNHNEFRWTDCAVNSRLNPIFIIPKAVFHWNFGCVDSIFFGISL